MAETVQKPRVWVMRPDGDQEKGYTFPWSWRRWQPEPRLMADSDTQAISSMGNAGFVLLRKERIDPDAAPATRHRLQTYEDIVIPGAYVAITAGDGTMADGRRGTIMDPSKVLWWGYITAVHLEAMYGAEDGRGRVEANEVGHLLDSQQVVAGVERHPTEPLGQVRQVNGIDSANFEGKAGQIVGNALIGKVSATDPTEVHYFAPLRSQCGVEPGQIWTRWRLFRHLCLLARPKALPQIDLDGEADPSPDTSTVPQYLNDFRYPEVLRIFDLTYRGAFDYLAPESHRLGWRIELHTDPNKLDRWRLVIAAIGSVAGYDLPSAVAVEAELSRDETVTLDDTTGDLPDEIAVEGGHCRFLVSASLLDGNAERNWTDGQLTAFQAATTAEERALPEHQDVFVSYVLKPDANNVLRVRRLPGESASALEPMCPRVVLNGDQARLAGEGGYTPYLPTARLAGDLPWPVGLKPDGTDTRSTEAKAAPTYLQAKVFRYDKDAQAALRWVDLTVSNSVADEIPSVEIDDRAPGLRVRYRKAQVLGKGVFDGINPDGEPGTVDYRQLVFTVAIDSDQTVYVSRARPGCEAKNGNGQVTGSDFAKLRRRVVYRDERFQFWCALVGSVLAVKDGVAQRITASNEAEGRGYVLRDDFKAAERYCNRLAAYAFRPRIAAKITLIRPDDPPAWAKPLTVIGTINDHGVVRSVGTHVRTVSRTWLGDQPRITVQTDVPSLATGRGIGPTSGGPISPSLGGTVPQMVQSLQSEVRELKDGSRRRVVVPPRGGVVPLFRVIKVIGGNTLVTGQAGIERFSSQIASVPSAYDPAVDTTFIPGIGRGDLYEDGVFIGKALIVHDSLSVTFSGALVQDDAVIAVTSRSIPVAGGGGAVVQAWQPYLL